MKNIQFPVYFATAYLVVYTMLAQIPQTQFLIPFMFIAAPLVVVWMVVMILQKGTPSDKTFDEAFYDDYSGK